MPEIDESAALGRVLRKWGPERFKVFVADAPDHLRSEGLDADVALISYLHVCHRYGVDPEPIPEPLSSAPETALDEVQGRRTTALSHLFAL